MRKMIKRLLKKYKYPPEEAANALETVIRQCEQWTDNDDSEPLYQKAPKKYEFPTKIENGLTTKLIDDYDSVLSAIFARLNKEDRAYVIDCKDKEKRGETKADVPQMIIDKITSIWNAIYPHRQIILEDAKIKAKTTSSEEYHAKEMSDGERVTIYLLGQCLIAPNDMTIIIDEPEIHLHKSIMYRLWDKIEEFCPNKTFIYITHDLDFAASRKEATKIWVKSYFGNNR